MAETILFFFEYNGNQFFFSKNVVDVPVVAVYVIVLVRGGPLHEGGDSSG
jgi:hypothetical protein